jgi:tetratricopeptide (TPR) repeat protein
LAAAFHLFYGDRDFKRARVQIAIAAKTLLNNSDLLRLMASIDQMQGSWQESTANLERAATLDPRNPTILALLADNYYLRRRYRDSDRISERLVELEPDEPMFTLNKPVNAFAEKADLKGIRAAYEALPSSMKDDPGFTLNRVYYAMCARDFAAAKEIVTKSQNQEIFFVGAVVPRQIVTLWLELVQGNHPTMEEFGAAREQLHQKLEADRNDPFLVLAVAFADVALGRDEESIEEGRRAMEMLPISDDAVVGPSIAADVALVYGWANRPNLAFEQLSLLVKIPSSLLTYGDLRTNPSWDPLRKDPRFDKLLAELAPRD